MKKERLWLVLTLLAVMGLVLAACAAPEEEAPAPEVEEEAEEAEVEEEAAEEEEAMEEEEEVMEEMAKPFRVAVVTPSATNDLAFSQSMWDALLVIQGEMGEENFEIAISDNLFVVEDAAAALRIAEARDLDGRLGPTGGHLQRRRPGRRFQRPDVDQRPGQ